MKFKISFFSIKSRKKSRVPKYFHPVGTSKNFISFLEATLSTAAAVGMDLAYPLIPVFWKYGINFRLAANTAKESEGVTKKAFFPKICKHKQN